MSNQINGFRVERIGFIKLEVVEILEENNVSEQVIGQIVRLMTELKTLAENQKPDYLAERRKVK